jgi:hypothetical protein
MEFRSYSQDINKTGPKYLIAFLHPLLKETILETEKIAIEESLIFLLSYDVCYCIYTRHNTLIILLQLYNITTLSEASEIHITST